MQATHFQTSTNLSSIQGTICNYVSVQARKSVTNHLLLLQTRLHNCEDERVGLHAHESRRSSIAEIKSLRCKILYMCSVTIASRSSRIQFSARLWQSGPRRYQRTPEGHQPCNRSVLSRVLVRVTTHLSQLVYRHTSLPSSYRRLLQAVMSASRGKSDVELFVLSGREAPELKELVHLPSGMHLLSTGRPDMELKGTRSETSPARFVRRCDFSHDCSQIGQNRIGRRSKYF